MSEQVKSGGAEDPHLLLFDTGIPGAYLDCQTSSYSMMLRSLKLDPRILGDQWWYSYDAASHQDWPGGAFSFTNHEYRESVSDWFGATERVIPHASPRQALERVRSTVSDGTAITVCVDLYHYRMANFFYRKNHYPRRIVVNGFQEDRFWVLDGAGERRFAGWLTEKELIPAIDSAHLELGSWGFNARNTTIEIIPPTAAHGPPSADWVRDRLLGPTRSFSATNQGRLTLVGTEALQAFSDALLSYSAELAEPASKMTLQISNILGGITSQRQLNIMFLELAAQYFPDLRRAKEHFQKSAREWDKAFNVFLFGIRLGRDPAAIVTELARRIDVIAEAECAGAAIIGPALAARPG